MTYRALTIAREYGSGGARIAGIVAERLGWRLLDSALIDEIARRAQVNPELARGYDERVDSWLHRLSRRALWHGGPAAVAALAETDVFDAETMAQLAEAAIEHAYEIGNCVIVGRGGQCILQSRPDVFHVFVYAPPAEKLVRLRARLGSTSDLEKLMRTMDDERAGFVRLRFGQDWTDRHLYNLLISSQPGEQAVADTILSAMRKGH